MAKIRGNTQILDGSIEFNQLSTTAAYTTDLTVSASSSELARADAIKAYIDSIVDPTLKVPEAYDPTVTGNYPTTYGGNAVQAGDSFRITAAQANIGGGSRNVNVEDLLIALVDNPSDTTDADWMVAESNRDQATETTLGVARIATTAEANAGLDDTTIITPKKLTDYLSDNDIGAVFARNGLYKNGNYIELGGGFTRDTILNLTDGSNKYTFDWRDGAVKFLELDADALYFIAGINVFGSDSSGVIGSGYSIGSNYAHFGYGESGGKIQLSITNTSAIFRNDLGDAGLEYYADYSTNYTNRSLVDKEYVDNAIISSASSRKYNQTTTLDIGNQTATLSTAPTNAFANVVVYLNGVRQILTTDYTITDAAAGEITFTASQILTTGDIVIIDYTDL